MANNNTPPSPVPPSPTRRRSSIAELFGSRSNTSNNNSGTPAFPSAMSTAMQARQQPRRVSVTTSIGLSGSPNGQSSPFANFGTRRRESFASSSGSGTSYTEEAVMEEAEGQNPNNTPTTPFARRVSFGAQAFGNVRSGSVSNGDGFNWGDNMREKSGKPMQSGSVGMTGTSPPNAPPAHHQRAATVAVVEPPKQMPVQHRKPDVLGERMLRGDFTMD